MNLEAAVGSGAFENLPRSLRSINFEGGNFKSVPSQIFQQGNQISELILKRNLITEIKLDDFKLANSLTNLDLAGNLNRDFLIKRGFEQIVARNGFAKLDISSNYMTCDENIHWMAKYVLCSSPQIIMQETYCHKTGKELYEYLEKAVPRPCRGIDVGRFRNVSGMTQHQF